MDDATTLVADDERSPPVKNPWVMAFVLGALMVTCVAPRTRYVPRPPDVSGTLSGVTFLDAAGEAVTPWEDGAAVLAFVPADDPVRAAEVSAVQHKLWAAYQGEGVELPMFTVTVGGDAGEAAIEKAIAAGLHASGGARPGWGGLWTPDPSAVLSGLSAEGTPDAWFTILDGEGQARGHYAVDDLEAMSEVFHRSRHVLRASR